MIKIDGNVFLERVYQAQDTIKRDSQLAKLLDVHQAIVSGWKRTKSIPYKRCYQIAQLLDLDLDKLLESNLAPKGATIEVAYYKNTPVSAGGGAFAVSEQPAETLKWEEKHFKKHIGNMPKAKNYMEFPVAGDSMSPTLENKDNVLTKPQTEYTGDGIYVVRYDGNMYIKRLSKQGANYILKSDNPQYPPITVTETDDFKIIAKALWRGGEL